MKKIRVFLYSLLLAIGTLAYNFTVANSVNMSYTDSENYMSKMLGVDFAVDEDGNVIDEDVELEGLGRLFRSHTINRQSANKRLARLQRARRVNRNRRYAMANVNKGQTLLIAKKGKLTTDSQKSIASGSLEFEDSMIYFTKGFLSLAGIVKLISSNDTLGAGYSNLEDSGVISKGKNVAVDFISLTKNSYDTATQTMFTTAFAKAYDTAILQNAELEVSLDGKTIFKELICNMNENRISENANVSTVLTGKNLSTKLLLKAESKLQIQINMPDGESIAAGAGKYTGVRVSFMGQGTKYR